jgi:hypothetical protein
MRIKAPEKFNLNALTRFQTGNSARVVAYFLPRVCSVKTLVNDIQQHELCISEKKNQPALFVA